MQDPIDHETSSVWAVVAVNPSGSQCGDLAKNAVNDTIRLTPARQTRSPD
jgi:hypothetical protein